MWPNIGVCHRGEVASGTVPRCRIDHFYNTDPADERLNHSSLVIRQASYSLRSSDSSVMSAVVLAPTIIHLRYSARSRASSAVR